TAYAGGLADISPVDALTTKDFRFTKRVCYLKKKDTLCDGCSQGSNVTDSYVGKLIYRLEARKNLDIDKWWICDEGRYGFHYVHSPSRVLGSLMKMKENFESKLWGDVVPSVSALLQQSKRIAVVVAADATLEDLDILKMHFNHAD